MDVRPPAPPRTRPLKADVLSWRGRASAGGVRVHLREFWSSLVAGHCASTDFA